MKSSLRLFINQSQHLVRSLFELPLLFIIPSLFMNACKDNPSELSLGKQYVESQTDLIVIDTFSVRLSTVILDSVKTSGTANALIGGHRDAVFGNISSNSYVQMAVPESNDVQQDDHYESFQLILRYNGYYFGDTTKPLKISVHQLAENIEFDHDDVISNSTSFHYQSTPIGSIVYNPKPTSPDTLVIRLSDDVGIDLFAKLRDNSDITASNELFTGYFHGLALIADDSYQGSIIGFSATQQDLRLVMFSSRSTAVPAERERKIEFKMTDSTKQFNNIVYDRSSTQLKTLSRQRDKLSSSATSGLSFLQGGVGLAIRVDFPSLQEALLFKRYAVMTGQLSIAPLRNSYRDIALPSSLMLYQADGINRIQGGVAASTLAIDELYNDETTYTFDVTQYLKDEFADSYVDREKGLLITLPVAAANSSFSRFVADANNRKTKLKIYYLSY
jgi:hypothetical protein